MKPIIVTPGDVFGKLQIIREVDRRDTNRRRFECRCECGRIVSVNLVDLKSNKTKSCGCWNLYVSKTQFITHGERRSVEYKILRGMVARCHCPTNKAFSNYGGRGIIVCDEWRKDAAAFIAHVGRRPSELHSIERIDNERGYEPGNVRWATMKEQCRNKRGNNWIEYNGERRLLIEVCEELGVRVKTIEHRIRRGWPDFRLFKNINATPETNA